MLPLLALPVKGYSRKRLMANAFRGRPRCKISVIRVVIVEHLSFCCLPDELIEGQSQHSRRLLHLVLLRPRR